MQGQSQVCTRKLSHQVAHPNQHAQVRALSPRVQHFLRVWQIQRNSEQRNPVCNQRQVKAFPRSALCPLSLDIFPPVSVHDQKYNEVPQNMCESITEASKRLQNKEKREQEYLVRYLFDPFEGERYKQQVNFRYLAAA